MTVSLALLPLEMFSLCMIFFVRDVADSFLYHLPGHPRTSLSSLHVPSTICGNECVNVYECVILGEGSMCMRYRLSANLSYQFQKAGSRFQLYYF